METTQATMTAADWMILGGLGLMFGAAGQLVRVGVGMVKLGKKHGADRQAIAQERDPWRIISSVAIGAGVGMSVALGASGLTLFLGGPADAVRGMDMDNIKGPFIASIIAAGYAGADLIEGLGRSAAK